MKKCITCGALKGLTEFNKLKRNKDGYDNECRKCRSKRCKKYYQKDKEKFKTYQKEWIRKNPEKSKEKNKNYYKKNRKKRSEKKKEWRKNNHIKAKIFDKKYRKNRDRQCKQKYGLSINTVARYGFKLALIIYDKFDRKCLECGNENNLVIHHLDGKGKSSINKNEKPNNVEYNLIVLCRKCHGRLHAKKYWDNKKKEDKKWTKKK